MAKLVDPDSLSATEVTITTGTKLITLNIAGTLDDNSPGSTSGVTKQAVYSYLKEEWKDDNALNKFYFPLQAFTKNEFLWINGWAPGDAQTRDLFRDAGWEESVGAQAGDLYAGMITLGNFDAVGDQGYYAQVAGPAQATTNFDKTGNVNEAVLIFDADGSDFTDYFKAFLREEAKLYASYDLLTEQGLSVLEATLYRFPLSNSPDINVNETDANVSSTTPYTNVTVDYLTGDHLNVTTWAATTAYSIGDIVQVGSGAYIGRYLRATVAGTSGGTAPTGPGTDGSVTWEVDPGERQIDTTYYHFSRIIDANNLTNAITRYEIYERLQWELRQTGNINDNINGDAFGTVNGNIADEFGSFVGGNLNLALGVWIDEFNVNDQNDLTFLPHGVDGATPTTVTYNFVSAGTFEFSANMVAAADADTRVTMYFLNDDPPGDNLGNDFDTANAVIVDDSSGTDIDIQVTAASVAWDYAYDTNTQRGAGAAGTNAPVIIQVCGLGDYENFTIAFTITRAANQTINITAPDERNYSNPV